MVYALEMWLMKTAFKIAYVILVPVSGTNWIETFWANVPRYPLLGRNEADSLNLRGETVRAIYTRKEKTRPQ